MLIIISGSKVNKTSHKKRTPFKNVYLKNDEIPIQAAMELEQAGLLTWGTYRIKSTQAGIAEAQKIKILLQILAKWEETQDAEIAKIVGGQK